MQTIPANELLAGLTLAEPAAIHAVVTDSRKVEPGCVFVCFPGERVDGHAFAAGAYRNGAAYIIANHPVDGVPEDRTVIVPDSARAMIRMASNYRMLFSPKMIGVTGSVGKTTTKEFCYAVLSAFGKTIKTEGNQNNDIGVPNTLFRLDNDTRYAVVEMGMDHLGEIERLTRCARPSAGIITMIGVSHLENLGTRENILKAKSRGMHMNLLMTLDRNYVPQLNVMLFSALHSDSAAHFDVYLLHDEGLSEEDVAGTRVLLGQRGELHLIRVNEDGLADAPTSDRYPKTIYYRIFAAKYLPDTLDRVLYLDPDIVVRQSLRELYEMPMGTAFFAAATHIRGFLHRFNELRLDMDEDSPYINSGVMLMNLQALRAEQNTQAVFDYMDAHKGRLMLPDQDIISALYGQRILPLDPIRYNMTEKLFALHRHNGDGMTLEDVRQQSAVIHYCGRNKPWKPGYMGELNVFYNEAVSQMSENGHH